MDTLLDDAFGYVDSDGRFMTKAEVLADVKSARVQQVVTEAMTAKLHENTAIVTGIFRMKGMEGGKPHLRRRRFVDVWMHKNGRWVAISSQATPIRALNTCRNSVLRSREVVAWIRSGGKES